MRRLPAVLAALAWSAAPLGAEPQAPAAPAAALAVAKYSLREGRFSLKPPAGWSGGLCYLSENGSRSATFRLLNLSDGARCEQTTSLAFCSKSALNQLRGPRSRDLTHLAERFSSIGLFGIASFGPFHAAKQPQNTDLPDRFVQDDGGGLRRQARGGV